MLTVFQIMSEISVEIFPSFNDIQIFLHKEILNTEIDINVPMLFSCNPLVTFNRNIFWTF